MKRFAVLWAALLGLALAQTAPAPSPYANQPVSPVRGLSAQEVADLLEGRGAGYARTAELNDHPGPRHALELKDHLGLSADQVAKIGAVEARMKREAKTLGARIVALEKALSASFASGSVTPARMVERTRELGLRYGELRAVHLRAHLEITPMLTKDQIARYNQMRGYASGGSHQHGK